MHAEWVYQKKNENMVIRCVECHIPFARFARSNIAPGTTNEVCQSSTPHISNQIHLSNVEDVKGHPINISVCRIKTTY